jgi:cytochrome b subunit of formate dehydrogenase
MKPEQSWRQSHHMDYLLDECITPVARMRLYSTGMGFNNRLMTWEESAGDRACLACGCCVDACPVVAERRRFVFLQNHRTSMALENIVGDECRRCFSCVRACPQVSKPVKDHVAAFRRPEKVVHALMAAALFTLAVTEILVFHFSAAMTGWERNGLKYLHLLAGFVALGTPFIFWVMDKRHFKRTLSRIFVLKPGDKDWLLKLVRHLASPRKHPMPFWGEFNPYQRFWYAYLICVLPVFALTGFISWLGDASPQPWWVDLCYGLHVGLGFCTDLLVLLHIYLKYLKNALVSWADMIRIWRRKRSFDYSVLHDPRQTMPRPWPAANQDQSGEV